MFSKVVQNVKNIIFIAFSQLATPKSGSRAFRILGGGHYQLFCSTHFPELNFLAVKKTSSASIYLLPSQVLSPEFVAIPQLLCCPITKFFVLNLLTLPQVLRHDFLETHFLCLSPVVTSSLRRRKSSRLRLFCFCIYCLCFCICVCVFVSLSLYFVPAFFSTNSSEPGYIA